MPPALSPGVIDRSIALLANLYQSPGRAYGPGMAIAQALRCTKRSHYDDLPQVRTRRHPVLYGPRGSVKSSISRFFLFDLIGGVDMMDPNAVVKRGEWRPTILNVSSGSSWERLRGSISNDGQVIPPVLHSVDWIYASELMSFLGHTPSDRSKRIENLNEAQEEGRMSVFLVKAFNVPFERRKEVADEIPDSAGYHYDPVHGYLHYDARFSMLSCSRILPEKLKDEMESSGYWSRQSIEFWDPTNAVAVDYANKKFGVATPENITLCRQKWLDLWNTKFLQVNAPPMAMKDELIHWFNAQLLLISEEKGQSFQDLFSARDDTDIMQLLTAAAIERISAARKPGDRSDVEAIDYTQADVLRTKAWLSARLAYLRSEHGGRLTEASAKESDKSTQSLLLFLQHLHKEQEPYDHFHSNEFVAFFAGRNLGGASTARHHLSVVKRAKLVAPDRYKPGHYVVDDNAIEAAGLPQVEDHVDESDADDQWEKEQATA